MKTYSFTSGPRIKVTVEGKGDTLTRTLLGHHNGFVCEISDELSEEATRAIYSWLLSYSQGSQPIVRLPIKAEDLPPFTEKVLEKMQKIAFGSVESYTSLAKKAGSPKAARAVGNICRANLFPLFIPCHRVRCEDGTFGGFAFGLKMKEELLRYEKAI